MNRLFWKFFLASFSALVIAAVGAAFAVSVQLKAADNYRGVTPQNLILELAGSTLRIAGPDVLADWLRHNQGMPGPRLYVVNSSGQELLGRELSQPEIDSARQSAASIHPDSHSRIVERAEGEYLLVAPPRPVVALPRRKGPDHNGPLFFPWPWLHIIAGTVASIVVSALLAWYMARPIGVLRNAFADAAGGRLDTRVGPLIGRRRDEIADLGHHFDRMAEQLQQLMAAQQRLLHDVSHELRSPLARVDAAIGLLRQNPDELDTALSRIERESTRLDELVGEVLTLARLDSKVISGAPERLNLADLLAEIVEDARFEAQASSRLVKAGRLDDAIVVGYPQLLHRAIENVVRNALKFAAAATEVEIDLTRAPGAIHAVITICDRGPGLAPDDIGSMFEPFWRASGTAGARGFGLGLAIAKRAIDLHRGNIRAENRAGGGLRVTLQVPVQLN